MADREQQAPVQGSPQQQANQSPARVVLTPPTEDQEKYLKAIEQTVGNYDPNVIVGGARRSRT